MGSKYETHSLDEVKDHLQDIITKVANGKRVLIKSGNQTVGLISLEELEHLEDLEEVDYAKDALDEFSDWNDIVNNDN